jgi:hypothetical protein
MKRPYNNLDTSSVDDLGNDLFTITICTIITFLFALLAGHCALKWYKWHCLRSHLRRTREACVSDPTTVYTGSTSVPSVTLTNHNLLMLQTDAQHPPLSRIAYTLSGKLRLSPLQHIHLHGLCTICLICLLLDDPVSLFCCPFKCSFLPSAL